MKTNKRRRTKKKSPSRKPRTKRSPEANARNTSKEIARDSERWRLARADLVQAVRDLYGIEWADDSSA